MTKLQAIKYSLIYISVILLGAFMAFKVWWTNSDDRFLGIIAFCMIGFGSLFLSISLTRIIISTKTDFDFSTLSNKQKYRLFKETVGLTKARYINASYLSLFVIIFAVTAYVLITSVNKYERYQLKTFGRLQKVRINDIDNKGKGTPYAFFDFYFDGKKYTSDLVNEKYSVGDSATIIFSTHNTDNVSWEEDFDSNNE